MSPNRSYGAVNKHAWQEVLHRLPNNVFDANSPLAQYTMGQRVGGFFVKVAELSAVGTLTGLAMSGLGSLDVQVRKPPVLLSLRVAGETCEEYRIVTYCRDEFGTVKS